MYFTSACMRVCVYISRNMMSCPEGHVLLDLALCSGTDQYISVRSSQELPRTDMQDSVTRCQSQRTCPQTCLTLSFHSSTGTLGMLWQSCLQPGGRPLFGLGLLGLWYSAPGQSAWDSTTPSASKLTLEGINSKAWGRYKLTLQSSAKKVTGNHRFPVLTKADLWARWLQMTQNFDGPWSQESPPHVLLKK